MPLHNNHNDSAHFNLVERKAREIRGILDGLIQDIVSNALFSTDGDGFSLSKHPRLQKYFDNIIKKATDDMVRTMNKQTKDSWERGNQKTINAVKKTLRNNSRIHKAVDNAKEINLKALQSFQKRKSNGITLSDRVWKITNTFKQEMEFALDLSIAQGKSAYNISREVRHLLKYPDKASRMIVDKSGNRAIAKLEKGVYESSYRNAMRLARTENNIAYHTASNEKYKEFDFVVGIEVRLSNNPKHCSFCESMAGKYPKDFKFTGWHPQCYSDDTEVMTSNGWKLFNDLRNTDLILSLNPETKQSEWVKFVHWFRYHRKGKMYRFHNRNTDMLVTPDHKMIYLSKHDGRIMDNKTADVFSKNNGGLYRSSEYSAPRIDSIEIGKHTINFDLFAEFMAYYLAEGSLFWTRKNQIKIAQSSEKHSEQYEKIKQCLEKMPFKFTCMKDGFYIKDENFYKYLKQFGKSAFKHVPDIIKNSSAEQIEIFLNAYAICDGYTRKTKSFVGSRGNTFTSDNHERVFFTSSELMSVDIGEMLIKIGKRPSYSHSARKGDLKTHNNGTYATRNDNYVIRECNSITATAFDKTEVEYDGFVYDIELEKNHIFYVRRNGKCVWGSNCRCTTVPILKTSEEMQEDNDAIAEGKEPSSKSKNEVSEPPKNFQDYISKNKAKIESKDNKPYFYSDNPKYTKVKEDNNSDFLKTVLTTEQSNAVFMIRKELDLDRGDLNKLFDLMANDNVTYGDLMELNGGQKALELIGVKPMSVSKDAFDSIVNTQSSAKLSFNEVFEKFDTSKFEKGYESRGNTVVGHIQEMQGFKGKASVLSDKDFDDLSGDNFVRIFRGVDNISQAEQFKFEEMFDGVGIFGNGTYFSNLYDTGIHYAKGNKKGVIDAKFDISKMNSIKFEDLDKEFFSEYRKAVEKSNGNLSEKERLFWSDRANYATAKGYDVIIAQQGNDEKFYVILNRTKLWIRR